MLFIYKISIEINSQFLNIHLVITMQLVVGLLFYV